MRGRPVRGLSVVPAQGAKHLFVANDIAPVFKQDFEVSFAFVRWTNTVEIAVIVKFQLDWNLDSTFELPELSHYVIKHHYLRETEFLVT